MVQVVQVCDFVIMFIFIFWYFFSLEQGFVNSLALFVHETPRGMSQDQLLVITAIWFRNYFATCSSGTGDAPVDCELSPSCPESVLDTTRHSQWFSCGVLCSWIEHALTRPPKLWSEPFGRLFVYWKWEVSWSFKRDPRLQGRPMSSSQAGTILLLRNSLARNWFRCVATDATPVMLTVVVWGPFSWMLRERTAD